MSKSHFRKTMLPLILLRWRDHAYSKNTIENDKGAVDDIIKEAIARVPKEKPPPKERFSTYENLSNKGWNSCRAQTIRALGGKS